MLNRREQLALLFLVGSLLVGTIVSALDHYRPEMMEDFRVIPAAVPVPSQPQERHRRAAAELADATRTPPQEGAGSGAVKLSVPVDVNSASAAELESLPHIGPATAARILEYRREHGAFQSLDQLRQVSGIGARTVDKLRPHAVAGPAK